MTPQNPPLRVVFLGTPAFAVPTLQALLDAPDFQVLGALTQPDRPAGRGQKLTPPPVKVLAERAGLPVFQPKSLRKDEERIDWLRAQAPDFLVTVAFGQILPQAVLDIPKYGTVNVHASLLPELRGANPIQWAILNGAEQTGITTMLTDIGVDTGDMLLTEFLDIGPEETAGELAERLSDAGAKLLPETLRGLAAGHITSQPQDHARATHAPKCDKADAVLNWEESAQALHNRIRAFNPAPGAVTFFRGERVKILRSRLHPASIAGTESEEMLKADRSGTILAIMESGIMVQTGQGVLEIRDLQPAGKKAMKARDWANGVIRGTDAPAVFENPTPAPTC